MRLLVRALLVLVLASPASAAVYYVNDTSTVGDSFTAAVGATSNNGLSRSTPKRNLFEIVSLLSAGDTVFIDAGMYQNESRLIVTVTNVTFQGVDSLVTVLDAGYETGFWLQGADRTRIQNLAIMNADMARDGGLGQYSAGIYVQNADSVSIVSDSFLSNANGVEATPGTDSLTVTGCWFGACQNWGYYAETASQTVITGNTFSGGSLGLYSRSDSARVVGNTFTGGRTVVVEATDSALLSGNTLSGNSELTITGGRRNYVLANTILDGKIVVNSGSSYTFVIDNACTIVGATNIDYYGESGVIAGNAVYGSGGGGYGFWLRTNAYGNLVRNNVAYNKRNYGFLVQGNSNWIDSNVARICQDGGFWLGSAGDTNLVTGNLADRTFGVGFQVDRAGNILRSNHARENLSHGFRVIGQGNWLRQNLADSNLGYGLAIVAGNLLDRNAIRTSLVRTDSGLLADTNLAVDASRTWWFTTDSGAIKNRIWGRGRDSVLYTPFRQGIADTASAGDTVAPAAPSGIAADSPNGVIRLTWAAPTLNEDSSATPGVSLYRVFRSRAADTTDWGAAVGETTALVFLDTGAASDTDYYYRVAAVDAATVPNASFYSGIVRGRGLVDNEPPIAALQKPSVVVTGRGETVAATLIDTGLGIASARLHARAAPLFDTTTAYTTWAMALESGSAANGSWTAFIPDTVIGTDTSRLLHLFVTCTDVIGRSSTTAIETVPIASGVDARVYLGNAQGETTEVTGSTAIATTNGSLSLRITSSIGDTVQIYRVPAGGANHTRLAFQANFADTTFTLAGPFSNGESVVVVVRDTLVNLPFAETYFYAADVTKPTISGFVLDPNRVAVDTTGVYVRVTFSTVEANARIFISQVPDTFAGAKNDTTARYTAQVIDSSVGLAQIQLTAIAGDTVTLYASAWDQAGNIADTARLQFRLDRAAPVVTLTAIANNRPVSESVTITATITDTTLDLGLQSVTLGVRTPDAVTDSYAMTALGGGVYRATVPGSKIGATAGTVTLNVTALDTFGQKGNATSGFTIASVSLQIADTGQSFAAVDTIWSQAITGYIRIFGSGDTVRVTNATANVAQPDTATSSTGASTDTVIVPVPLLAGVNRVAVTRISAAGDSASFTRWFVADTTAPVLTSVLLDTNAAATGSTTCVLTFASADSFAVAAYRVLGATTDSSYTFLGFSGAATFYRTITLTSGSGFKSVSVEVRDTAGNISSGLADTIELVVGAGTVITPTFNAGAGETQALVTRTLVDQVSETVTVLQGGSDTVITYILQRGTDGDTIRILIDFADTVRNSRTVVSVPDTNPLAASADSISLIADFAAGYRTIREIVVTDSLGNPIGAASEIFNSVRLTWHLDSTLASRKSALEIFFWDTPSRRWLYARTFDSVVNRGARDSFVNYATGDTISIVVRHFTIYAVFPAGGFTQTSVQNVVVFPNPYVPYDGNLANGEAGSAFAEGIYIGNVPAGSSVEIFDVRGRKVTEMTPAEVAANTNGLVRWNARNRDNQEVASGVYLVVVKGPGGTAVRKAAVVR